MFLVATNTSQVKYHNQLNFLIILVLSVNLLESNSKLEKGVWWEFTNYLSLMIHSCTSNANDLNVFFSLGSTGLISSFNFFNPDNSKQVLIIENLYPAF